MSKRDMEFLGRGVHTHKPTPRGTQSTLLCHFWPVDVLMLLVATHYLGRSHPDYPQGVRRQFVTWANDSQCAQQEDVPVSWVWRQQCMAGLLIAATATGRTALVHQSMAGIYNLGHIQRWCVGGMSTAKRKLVQTSHCSFVCGYL